MIFDCHYVIKMLEDIEKNAAVKGKNVLGEDTLFNKTRAYTGEQL